MDSPKGDKTLILPEKISDDSFGTVSVPKFNWKEFNTEVVFQSAIAEKIKIGDEKTEFPNQDISILDPYSNTGSSIKLGESYLQSQPDNSEKIHISSLYLREGTILNNRYEIKKKLGAGGFGETFLVTDEEDYLKTEWVLKLLDSKRVPDGDVAKFIQKLKSQYKAWKYFSDTSPDCIVRLLSVKKITMPQGNETVGLLMEYMPGGDLLELLERWGLTSSKPLIPSQIDSLLIYFKQICQSVLALHKENFLHRDLKPSNIFLADDEKKCKLGDFDLLFDIKKELLAQTVSFQISGTPAYMAPEVFEGKQTELSDIYSIGATFYYCLSGKHPFEGDSPSEIFAKMFTGHEPESLSKINPLIPIELDQLILRCLKNKTDDRPSSVSDILKDLDRIGNFGENSEVSPLNNSAPVRLTELLLQVLSEEDRADLIEDLRNSDYRSRRELRVHEEQDLIEEYCYTNKPDEILLERLTKLQLKKLAKLLSISTEKLDSREEMIRRILLAIGFLPGIKKISGIETTRNLLEKSTKNFTNADSSNECIGILNDAFTSLELFLTLLIKFYGQLRHGAGFEAKLAKHVGGHEKWSFGAKTQILRILSDSVNKFPERAKSVFSKKLFSNEIFELLKESSDCRNLWIHQEEERKGFNEIKKLGRTFLTASLEAIKKITESKNFPRVVQIISSQTDIYGRHFYYGQDEVGHKEKIFTPLPLKLGEVYLFFPLTNPARINPLIFQYDHKKKK